MDLIKTKPVEDRAKTVERIERVGYQLDAVYNTLLGCEAELGKIEEQVANWKKTEAETLGENDTLTGLLVDGLEIMRTELRMILEHVDPVGQMRKLIRERTV